MGDPLAQAVGPISEPPRFRSRHRRRASPATPSPHPNSDRRRNLPRQAEATDAPHRDATPGYRGRGAPSNPANRFETIHLDVLPDAEQATEADSGVKTGPRKLQTQVFADRSRTIINRVDSPDIGFHWTLNPYRGCEHGCIYCYARPTHECLGFSSGLDFETKLMAKLDAPNLLRKELARPRWQAETIVMSGVTDPYQPIEARLGLTRRCLEVLAAARQPVSLVTKSRLVLRDLDLLQRLAEHRAVRVAVSLTTLDHRLAAKMEPRASSPADRVWAIRRLASAGVEVVAMIAPIIPAITDREVPKLLEAAADAGAQGAGYVLLRLPHQNKELFMEWLDRCFPGRRSHVESLLRQVRGGELYNAEFGQRKSGTGPYAEQIRTTFDLFARRFGLQRDLGPLNADAFRRPVDHEQMPLFAE